ncbi:MAG TPA: hypothetical protein VJK03_01705 [Candidatus Nanoarchaeia archaeon]|nr:hypothetical protein [Candidatus Nanoarchaeia archaeon]
MNDIMDWNACLRKNARPAEKDDNIINSLIESADANLKVTQSIKQENISYSSIVVLAYDSLRMLLEALALKTGYKIYNHECYYSFLKEVLHKDDWADKFNPARLIRNSVNYYGKRLNKDEFEVIYFDILFLIPLIKEMVIKNG